MFPRRKLLLEVPHDLFVNLCSKEGSMVTLEDLVLLGACCPDGRYSSWNQLVFDLMS